MLFGQDRNQMRRIFFDSWHKAEQGLPLQPLERMIADIIRQHPEYIGLLSSPEEQVMERDYLPEHGQSNPFLHMGMHIAIQEQLSTRRPAGIEAIHAALVLQCGDRHDAEHHMMECLAEMIWQAQKNGQPPDEQAYLRALRELIQR